MGQRALYILYNADASVMGKIWYGYKKMTCPKDSEQVCAACDITHGGLSLRETPSWAMARREIEATTAIKVYQWHRDELSPKVRSFVETENVSYPVVLYECDEKMHVVLDRSELNNCDGDAEIFLRELRMKNVLPEQQK